MEQLKQKIKERRDDYHDREAKAEIKRDKDPKNYQVLSNVINEYNARASELTWVLDLFNSTTEATEQNNQEWKKFFKAPFRYDPHSEYVVDANGKILSEARNWSKIGPAIAEGLNHLIEQNSKNWVHDDKVKWLETGGLVVEQPDPIKQTHDL